MDDVSLVMRSVRRRVVVLSIVSILGAAALVALFSTTSDDTASTARSAGGETKTERRTHGSVDGIRLDGFGSAKPVELTSFRGKPLVVNYWASWCLFCIEEMPDFQSVYEEIEGDDGKETAATLRPMPRLPAHMKNSRLPTASGAGGLAAL